MTIDEHAHIKILVVEDHAHRVERFKGWADDQVHFIWATSAAKAIGIINRDSGEVLQGIMLDHDLTDNSMDGRDIVPVIIERISRSVPVFVHSANKSYARPMAESLKEEGFSVEQTPMANITKDEFLNWIEYVREAF